jgi:anti-sigma factor RsiW
MDAEMHSGRDQHDEDMTSQPCASWQPLLTLLAAGELDPAAHDRLAAHLAGCAACSTALERERQLLALLAAHREEPGADLLAACRAGISDALDREEERGWLRRSFELRLPASWLSPRPAWSAAILLILGFSVGFFGPRLLRQPVAPAASQNAAGAPNATNTGATSPAPGAAHVGAPAGSAPLPLDVRSADVAAINVFPSGGGERPRVELRLAARQPVTLAGTVDDDDVKSALLDIVRHADRYGQDVRLDALGLLRACNGDPEVCAVLCRAVHMDRSPAVRLKALEALGGAEPQDIVRQTLLDALAADDNPAVRIQAINDLRDMAARGQIVSDPRALAVLRDRMQKDSNAYIRLQSAAAIRDLALRSSANLP